MIDPVDLDILREKSRQWTGLVQVMPSWEAGRIRKRLEENLSLEDFTEPSSEELRELSRKIFRELMGLDPKGERKS